MECWTLFSWIGIDFNFLGGNVSKFLEVSYLKIHKGSGTLLVRLHKDYNKKKPGTFAIECSHY